MKILFASIFALLNLSTQTPSTEYAIQGTLNGKVYSTKEYTATISSNVPKSKKSQKPTAKDQTLTIATWFSDGTEFSFYIRDLTDLKSGKSLKIDPSGRITVMANIIAKPGNAINFGMGGKPYIGQVSGVFYEEATNTISFTIDGKIGSFISKGKVLDIKNLTFKKIKLEGQKLGI